MSFKLTVRSAEMLTGNNIDRILPFQVLFVVVFVACCALAATKEAFSEDRIFGNYFLVTTSFQWTVAERFSVGGGSSGLHHRRRLRQPALQEVLPRRMVRQPLLHLPGLREPSTLHVIPSTSTTLFSRTIGNGIGIHVV